MRLGDVDYVAVLRDERRKLLELCELDFKDYLIIDSEKVQSRVCLRFDSETQRRLENYRKAISRGLHEMAESGLREIEAELARLQVVL